MFIFPLYIHLFLFYISIVFRLCIHLSMILYIHCLSIMYPFIPFIYPLSLLDCVKLILSFCQGDSKMFLFSYVSVHPWFIYSLSFHNVSIYHFYISIVSSILWQTYHGKFVSRLSCKCLSFHYLSIYPFYMYIHIVSPRLWQTCGKFVPRWSCRCLYFHYVFLYPWIYTSIVFILCILLSLLYIHCLFFVTNLW